MKSKAELLKSKEYWIETLEVMDFNKLSSTEKANRIIVALSKVHISNKPKLITVASDGVTQMFEPERKDYKDEDGYYDEKHWEINTKAYQKALSNPKQNITVDEHRVRLVEKLKK